MLLFGHRFIKNENFYHILDIESITNTPPSATLYVVFSEKNLDIIEHLKANEISFALSVKNITELIYAESLNATYIVVAPELAKTAQSIAENYLFDAKILVSIEEESSIEEMAELGIDGVIFSSAVIKINS